MQAPAPTEPLTLKQLTTILIKHHGLHEGLYDLSIEFSFAVGAIGPKPDELLPGAMIGVSRIGISTPSSPGPNTVDAAEVNPRKAATRSRAAKVK